MSYRVQTDEEIWADLKRIQSMLGLSGMEVPEDALERTFMKCKHDPNIRLYSKLLHEAVEKEGDASKLVVQLHGRKFTAEPAVGGN